ncbi:hypothetical protein Tco_0825253 [Tanacetum coccineum]
MNSKMRTHHDASVLDLEKAKAATQQRRLLVKEEGQKLERKKNQITSGKKAGRKRPTIALIVILGNYTSYDGGNRLWLKIPNNYTLTWRRIDQWKKMGYSLGTSGARSEKAYERGTVGQLGQVLGESRWFFPVRGRRLSSGASSSRPIGSPPPPLFWMQTAMERYVAASQQEVSQIYQHLQVPPPLVLDPSQFLDPKEDATNDNQEDATDVGGE